MRNLRFLDEPFSDSSKPYRLFMCMMRDHALFVIHHKDGGIEVRGFVPYNEKAKDADRQVSDATETLATRLARDEKEDHKGYSTGLYLHTNCDYLTSAFPLPFATRRCARVIDELSTYKDITQGRLTRAQEKPRKNAAKIREIQATLSMEDRELLEKYLTHPYNQDVKSIVVEVGLLTEAEKQRFDGTLRDVDNYTRCTEVFTLGGVEHNCSGLAMRVLQQSGIADPLVVASKITSHRYYDPTKYVGHLSVYGYSVLMSVRSCLPILKDTLAFPITLAIGITMVIPYIYLKAACSSAYDQLAASSVGQILGLEKLPGPSKVMDSRQDIATPYLQMAG